MSKGLGRVERHVVNVLALDGATMVTWLLHLARSEGLNISEPSLRRAIGSLQRKGLIEPLIEGKRPTLWVLKGAAKKEWSRRRARSRTRRESDRERFERQHQEDEAMQSFLGRMIGRADPEAHTLARILGMLGSDADGECLAAARKVEAARRKTGKSWHQLLGLE